MGALSSRQIQVLEALAQVVSTDDDLVEFTGERRVRSRALKRELEHPKQLLEIATLAACSTLVVQQ